MQVDLTASVQPSGIRFSSRRMAFIPGRTQLTSFAVRAGCAKRARTPPRRRPRTFPRVPTPPHPLTVVLRQRSLRLALALALALARASGLVLALPIPQAAAPPGTGASRGSGAYDASTKTS